MPKVLKNPRKSPHPPAKAPSKSTPEKGRDAKAPKNPPTAVVRTKAASRAKNALPEKAGGAPSKIVSPRAKGSIKPVAKSARKKPASAVALKTAAPKTAALTKETAKNAATKNAAAKAQLVLPKAESKARRARVPTNLAAQYGERGKKRAPEKTVERKARRDAAARAERQRVMAPSEELLQRLARAGAIALHGIEAAPSRAKPAKTRRSRKWESRCGKCTVVSTFATTAGLCARCGAIAIREA